MINLILANIIASLKLVGLKSIIVTITTIAVAGLKKSDKYTTSKLNKKKRELWSFEK
jgi:hypothetical protein